ARTSIRSGSCGTDDRADRARRTRGGGCRVGRPGDGFDCRAADALRGALVLQSVRMGAARRTEGGIAPFERRETDMSGGEQGVGAIASSDRLRSIR
ncbi:hypothetical protein, partial [Burkholderia pseudomallei]|uniref:hypothetical protein n=1 Tax=Burkholderia pseudomallei TaxID=28450 RepID=UPI0021BA5492